MKHRLAGLETEYAFRCTYSGDGRPDHRLLYEAFLGALKRITHTIQGSSSLKWKQVFTENGSAYCYESLPYRPDGGLLEGATPECDRPGTVALYQLAQDRLIARTIPNIEKEIRREFPGIRLGIVKNCRDASGHIYGAQENYEAEFLEGKGKILFPLFLKVFLPIFFVYLLQIFLISFIIAFAQILILTAGFLIVLLLQPAHRVLPGRLRFRIVGRNGLRSLERLGGWVLTVIEVGLSFPLISPFLVALRMAGFRRQRRVLTSFLVSRIIITGSGTINADGSFHLSEKAGAIRRLIRCSNLPADRSIFDTGNLLKLAYQAALGLLRFDFSPMRQILSPVQRLQIGLSDSCMASIPLFLKTALTSLMLDLAEAGELDDAPELKDPIEALHRFNGDPDLKATSPDRSGHEWTALALQRWYLEKAKTHLHTNQAIDMESVQAVRLWEDLLGDLERDPILCFGRLDWPTKQSLIKRLSDDTAESPFDYDLAKTVDLAYHELEEGYFESLRREGLTVELFEEADVDRAAVEPPDSLRGQAALRGEIIRESTLFGEDVAVSWNHVRTGVGLHTRILSLEEYRRRKERARGR